MSSDDNKCMWGCGHEYGEFNAATEQAHLRVCPIFQSLPVAEIRDGRAFVRCPPPYEEILVERERKPN